MISYHKNKPLIFIHIPKCAGTSIDILLKKWFREKFSRHGLNKESPYYRTTPYEVKPGMCISGHFSRSKGIGVRDIYPEVDQWITFLRDPFEIALSYYFFWKRKRSFIPDFMPVPVTIDNYQEVLDNYFVHVGIVEALQASVDILADKLGFPREKVNRFNKFERDETVSAEVKEEYVNNNRLQYLVYNYVRCQYKQ